MASPKDSFVEHLATEPKIASCHAVVIAAVFLVFYLAGTAIYAVTLHPLSRSPGPTYTSLSYIPFWIACITGRQVQWMHELHCRYGPVVRYGPNQLSYVDTDFTAWKAIHGHEKGGREFPKAKEWFVAPSNGTAPWALRLWV